MAQIKKLLFDGKPVEFNITGTNKYENLNKDVPDQFIKWLMEAQSNIHTQIARDKAVLITYPPELKKKDKLNHEASYQPAGIGISTRITWLFKESWIEEGITARGDGREHEIVIYERIKNDKTSPKAIDGKIYCSREGRMEFPFKGNLILGQHDVLYCVFLKFMSPQKGKAFVIDNSYDVTMRQRKKRKLYSSIISILEAGVPENKLRAVASGEFNIKNAYDLDLDTLVGRLGNIIDAYNMSTDDNSFKSMVRFNEVLTGDSDIDVIEKKAFTRNAYEQKAVIVQSNGKRKTVHVNTGVKGRFNEFGKTLFELKGNDLHNIPRLLYDFLYLTDSNKDYETMIKSFLHGKDVATTEENKIRDEYFNLYQTEAPMDMPEDWIKNQVKIKREEIEALKKGIIEGVEVFEGSEESLIASSNEINLENINRKSLADLQQGWGDIFDAPMAKNILARSDMGGNRDWVIKKIKEKLMENVSN